MNHTDTVTAPMTFMLTTPDGLTRSVRAELRYKRADAWSVTISFQVSRTGRSDWVFGRDLLAEGLFTTVGEGDVKIGPSEENTKTTRIELAPAGAGTVVEGVTSELQAFLHRCYDMVPLGQENGGLDVDLAFQELLASVNN